MGFVRACSYTASITTPKVPSSYSAILVTLTQEKEILVSKDLNDLELSATEVLAKLNQEETKRFKAGIPAYLQIRCYASEYDAPGSRIWQLDVLDALDDQILGEE